jgi:hypothetical protein
VLPTRPSRLKPPPVSVRTQRTLPRRTASASHATVISLSRPEKPPSATTSPSAPMIDAAAPCWLDTATVPPPCARA